MSTPAHSDTELLTEHFGYPPVSLLDDIINSINIIAERALNSIEQGLLDASPASLGFRQSSRTQNRDASSSLAQQGRQQKQASLSPEEAQRHEVEAGTHQLETLLCASIDRNFDKFELYVMRNILCVKPEDRDWIRLGHYDGLDLGSVQKLRLAETTHGGGESSAGGLGHDRPGAESVNRLRRRLQASQKLNCMLHAERARNAALLRDLRGLVAGDSTWKEPGVTATRVGQEGFGAGASSAETTSLAHHAPLGFLSDKGDLAAADANTPLTITTAFTLSQLQALRTLSTSLRVITPELGEDMTDDKGPDMVEERGRKTWRRERVEYVEKATRKHLESVRGLELGKSGEVRDGEWQGEGRDLARGEVEGLEKIVSILSGGSESSPGGQDTPHQMDES